MAAKTKLLMSKLSKPAAYVVRLRAPSAPSGTATSSANKPNTITMPTYMRTNWLDRAPTAFITPICRTCCVKIAPVVLMTKKPLSTSDKPPNTPKINSIGFT